MFNINIILIIFFLRIYVILFMHVQFNWQENSMRILVVRLDAFELLCICKKKLLLLDSVYLTDSPMWAQL